MGAQDILLGKVPGNLTQEMEKGRRVVVIGYFGGSWLEKGALPSEILPVCGIVLEDTIRKNAKMSMFQTRLLFLYISTVSGKNWKMM